MGGSSGGGSTTTVQKTDPPAFLTPLMTRSAQGVENFLFGSAGQLQAPQPQGFGPQVANFVQQQNNPQIPSFDTGANARKANNQQWLAQVAQAQAPPQPTLPPPEAQPGVTAPGLFEPFEGPAFAAPTAQQFAGLQALQNQVPLIGAGAQDFAQMLQGQARGDFLNPASNPYLSAVMRTAIEPQLDAFRQTVVPQLQRVKAEREMFGVPGPSRADVAFGQELDTLMQNVRRTTVPIAFQNYQLERGIQQQTPQLLAANAQALGLAPQSLFNVGEALQGLDQQGIDNTIRERELNATLPFAPLAAGFSALGASSGGFSQTSGTSTGPAGPSKGAQAAKGAIGGGLAAAALGAGVPWIAGAAALGGILGIL